MTGIVFRDKALRFTEENALFSAPSTVVVGVSGGADSMALLHVLHSRRDEGICVHAVHVHHGLRGEEADRDEQLVHDYCAQRAIPYHAERVDVRAFAAKSGCGLEETGRRVRYEIFERLRTELQADYIATAHHADDNTETMLMHIIRGCGVSGLVGIPAKRGCIIRPLLCCTRAEIEAYCAAESIPYRVDGTNADIAFTRNRVRHEVLPLLRQINLATDAALQRLCAAAAQDEAYFTALATKALVDAALPNGYYSCTELYHQPSSVRVRMWRILLARIGCETYTERHIEALETALRNNRGKVYLPNGCCIAVSAGRVAVLKNQPHTSISLPIDALPFCLSFDGKQHGWQIASRDEWVSLQKVHKLFFKYSIDYDKIQGGLTLRFRHEGDYISLYGRRVGKTLKKIFQEYHIPSFCRDTYPLLCDDGGVVLIPGVDCAKRVCPDESTKHFLVWMVDGEPCYDTIEAYPTADGEPYDKE